MVNGTLLWVDDEMELLKAYVIFLEKKDYEVVTATNGQDALDLCRERSFDLIFLDENMPGLSGLETLSRIKEICPTSFYLHFCKISSFADDKAITFMLYRNITGFSYYIEYNYV